MEKLICVEYHTEIRTFWKAHGDGSYVNKNVRFFSSVMKVKHILNFFLHFDFIYLFIISE